ncbi:MAG: serine/threonine protein kinase [Wenzhouxiangella sp.]
MTNSREKSLSLMRRRAVDRLLADYLERSPTEQPGWLAVTRQRLPRLSRWLEQLINQSDTVTLLGDSLDRLAAESVARLEADVQTLEAGDRLGPWEVCAEVGQGGMGRVYRGRRIDGAFEMEVAIKQIGQRRRGLADLLQRECRLLARLDHPGITRVVDAGLDERCGPFLIMEWVDGQDLTDWLANNQADWRQRLAVFQQVLEAVEHAHQRLIIHGDIKPGNLRITPEGQVKLLDFGIARLTDSDETGQARIRALTPAYAAPELFEGEPASLRSDIYALGRLLHTLAGSQEPSGNARRALLAITKKACNPSAAERYASVTALADDLQRLKCDQPVLALPQTRRYRLGCLLRRNKLASGLVALLCLSLIGGLAGLLWQTKQTREAANRAISEGQRAEAVRNFLVEMLAQADPRRLPGEAPTVRDVLRQSADTIDQRFAGQPDIAFELHSVIGQGFEGLGDRQAARPHLEAARNLIADQPSLGREPLDLAWAKYRAARMLPASSEKREKILQAQQEMLRHDESDPLLESEILLVLAHDAFMRGDVDQAVSMGQAAEALACPGDESVDRASVCISILSDLYFYLDRSGQSQAALNAARQGHELAQAHFEEATHPGRINIAISYINALVDDQQTGLAVAEGERMLEQVERGYQVGDSPLPAYIRFPLARAQAAAGKDHLAVITWSKALDLMLERQPDGLGIPVQLNFLAQHWLELGRPERAVQAYRRYFPAPWDNTPSAALQFRQVNEWRIQSLEHGLGEDGWQAIFDQLHERFEEDADHWRAALLRFAISEALADEDADLAGRWIEQARALDERPGGAAVWNSLLAHWHLLQDQSGQAEDSIRQAQAAFEQRGEATGPRWARLQALKAEWLCRNNHREEGRAALAAAIDYWHREAGLANARPAILALAGHCSQPPD